MINDILYWASYFHKHANYVSTSGCFCFGSDTPDQICEEVLEKDYDNLGCDKS